MENLVPVTDDEYTSPSSVCWHSLFPSTNMALGFPVPPHPAGVGLRVSFDVMLQLAGNMYHVDQEKPDADHGIYFRGASSILYPTAHFPESNTVQWHLMSNMDTTKLGPDWSPDDFPDRRWLKIKNFEMLRSATTFLGYD